MSKPLATTLWCVKAHWWRAWVLQPGSLAFTKTAALESFRNKVMETGPPWPTDYVAVKVRITEIDTAGRRAARNPVGLTSPPFPQPPKATP